MNQLTCEQEFFITVLKDFLHERQTAIPQNHDWDLIKAYANHHEVTAIFYKQTQKEIFQKQYASQIYRYTNFKHTMEVFKCAISEYPYILVKGAVVAELYPVPALRSMGDVDALIHLEDRNTVNNVLIGAGFELQNSSEIGEWKYKKNGYIFEVHDSLVHRYAGKKKSDRVFFPCMGLCRKWSVEFVVSFNLPYRTFETAFCRKWCRFPAIYGYSDCELEMRD